MKAMHNNIAKHAADSSDIKTEESKVKRNEFLTIPRIYVALRVNSISVLLDPSILSTNIFVLKPWGKFQE